MDRSESRRLKFRTVLVVIKTAGFLPWTIVFFVLFFVASLVVALFDPAITSFGDSVWLMFQVISTIGLGDFTCTTTITRAAAIVLSLYSVFFIALVTGAVVSFCSERMKARLNVSVAHFIDQLEHLPELSHEELQELSNNVKEFSRRNSL